MKQLLSWALLLALLSAAALLALRPDPRDALRAADQLFLGGRYYDALRAYQRIDPRALPVAALRLGMVRAIRGEHTPAERALRLAMQGGLRPADYQLALIYLGQVLADDGRAALASKTWALTDDCRSPDACAYRAPARILLAEQLLRQGDYAAAEADYLSALGVPPPAPWASLATYRMALLLAARDPGAAIATIWHVPPPSPAVLIDPLLAPLLPADIAWRGELVAALSALPDSRPYRLGQLYLGLGLYSLAEDQFARVRPESPSARIAAVYAAYVRWRAGDHQGGLDQLTQIVREQPDDPQARALLALAYVSAGQGDAARDQIDALARQSPSAAEIHLAQASWYVARREYPQASLEYSQAIAQAPAERRGHYALLGAQFHLVTTYDLCASGMPLAEAAVKALPADGAAWTALAAYQYYCGQPGLALSSAQRAADSGGGAESVYYLGAALVALGEPDRARSELIRAADLAPASVWRERAEAAIAAMPPRHTDGEP
ncbi:MAG: tetratricopeptide repeat protein [Chloroflexales bacterium]